jgi:signal-transduction protein with cAMP-binding, CBS, and nucleotidyltransferase domain
MYFITKGTAMLYDKSGITPFLQLPQHSWFGEYQLMFDLRANFVIKVGGKEDFEMKTSKEERTFFLCVTKSIFQDLLNQFPKSKFFMQKRALQRRRTFIEHLEKTELLNAKYEVVKAKRVEHFRKES